ncbi:B12-binding domain-containing radical SAM protein [candidate division CSSED10-310 bacterium]|uniref:B12-binding domain-containing radical SAM protein n=1 Tax=candidate division CSSED10-310 bacterium TaxID=2855610 RepID=A0ABV6Z1M8_UNCC1
MKILFINPVPPGDLQPIAFHHGIGSLSAVLKEAGHHTAGLILSDFEAPRIDETIVTCQPDLIGISCVTNQMELATQVANYVLHKYSIPVIAGGVHATVAPLDWLAVEKLFAVCRGESEEALLELVERMEHDQEYLKTRNFWFKRHKTIQKNELRPLIDDLSLLPLPDREVFDFQMLVDEHPEAEFLTGRDCPYTCSYCINATKREIYHLQKLKIRRRNVAHVLEEINHVLARYHGITRIGFDDDIFTFDRDWLITFCEEYKKQHQLPFWINARVNHLDQELITTLSQSGCEEIRMGVESGDPHIRREVLHRHISDKQIESAFELVKKAGIKTWSFNMIGFPTETEETLFKTIDLNKKLQPDEIFVSIFQPYQGTPIYNKCQEEGLLKNNSVSSYFAPHTLLRLKHISEERLLYLYKVFRNFVHSPAGIYHGLGWHDWEEENGHSFRWTEKEAEFLLEPEKIIKAVSVTFSCHHPDIQHNPVTCFLTVPSQSRQKKIVVSHNNIVAVSIKLKHQVGRRTRLTLSVDRTWNPHVVSGAADDRDLGLKVLRISSRQSTFRFGFS